MIRVLQITKNLGLGGRERIVAELAGGLLDEGFHSTICCLEKSGEWASLCPEVIKIIELRKKSGIDWGVVTKIRDYIKTGDIPIVHAHNPGTLFYGALSSRCLIKRKLITTEHGFSESVPLRSRIKERILYRMVDQVCAVSNKLANDLFYTYGLKPNKINMVRNGINSATVSEAPSIIKNRLRMSSVDFNIGIVARLIPVKNHHMLFRAFSLARLNHPKLRLWIIGIGELRDELEGFARQLGIFESVVFLGLRTDVPTILNALDAFVLCSKSEGLSVTLLEAMSAGLPIIATAVGGNCEAIKNKNSGILVESDNHKQLANAIRTIYEDPILAKNLGANARKRFEDCFSVKRMVRETAAVYRAALNERSDA